jgi:hypothetical protein
MGELGSSGSSGPVNCDFAITIFITIKKNIILRYLP